MSHLSSPNTVYILYPDSLEAVGAKPPSTENVGGLAHPGTPGVGLLDLLNIGDNLVGAVGCLLWISSAAFVSGEGGVLGRLGVSAAVVRLTQMM